MKTTMGKIIKFPGNDLTTKKTVVEGNKPDVVVELVVELVAKDLVEIGGLSQEDALFVTHAKKRIVEFMTGTKVEGHNPSHNVRATLEKIVTQMSIVEITEILGQCNQIARSFKPTYYSELYRRFSNFWNDIMEKAEERNGREGRGGMVIEEIREKLSKRIQQGSPDTK